MLKLWIRLGFIYLFIGAFAVFPVVYSSAEQIEIELTDPSFHTFEQGAYSTSTGAKVTDTYYSRRIRLTEAVAVDPGWTSLIFAQDTNNSVSGKYAVIIVFTYDSSGYTSNSGWYDLEFESFEFEIPTGTEKISYTIRYSNMNNNISPADRPEGEWLSISAITEGTNPPAGNDYSISIPASLDLGIHEPKSVGDPDKILVSDDLKISASVISLEQGKKISVKIYHDEADEDFLLHSGENQLNFTVHKGSDILHNGDEAASFIESGEVSVNVQLDQSQIQFSGNYSGIIFFDISLIDEE